MYVERNIYKIGCTDNISRRLKQFNASRMYFDQLRVVCIWKVANYFKCETAIHKHFVSNRIHNEFFEIVCIKDIEDFVKSYLYKPMITSNLSNDMEWLDKVLCYCKYDDIVYTNDGMFKDGRKIDIKCVIDDFLERNVKYGLGKYTSESHRNLIAQYMRSYANIVHLIDNMANIDLSDIDMVYKKFKDMSLD